MSTSADEDTKATEPRLPMELMLKVASAALESDARGTVKSLMLANRSHLFSFGQLVHALLPDSDSQEEGPLERRNMYRSSVERLEWSGEDVLAQEYLDTWKTGYPRLSNGTGTSDTKPFPRLSRITYDKNFLSSLAQYMVKVPEPWVDARLDSSRDVLHDLVEGSEKAVTIAFDCDLEGQEEAFVAGFEAVYRHAMKREGLDIPSEEDTPVWFMQEAQERWNLHLSLYRSARVIDALLFGAPNFDTLVLQNMYQYTAIYAIDRIANFDISFHSTFRERNFDVDSAELHSALFFVDRVADVLVGPVITKRALLRDPPQIIEQTVGQEKYKAARERIVICRDQ